MTLEEYFKQLDNIHKLISEDDYVSAGRELDKMYLVKPVRLRWFVEKADFVLRTTGDYVQAFGYLGNYVWELYEYSGMAERLQLHQKFIQSYGDILDEQRVKGILCRMRRRSGSISLEEEQMLSAQEDVWKKCVDSFFEEDLTNDLVNQLQNAAFEKQDVITYIILDWFAQKVLERPSQLREWVPGLPNIGYLREQLQADVSSLFLIITDTQDDVGTCELLANLLDMPGKDVILLDLPTAVEADEGLTIEQTLTVSIDNMEQAGNHIRVIHPIALSKGQEIVADNRDLIVNYVNQTFAYEGLSVVLCTGSLMDELCERVSLRRTMQNLSDFQADYMKDNIALGWVGNYLTYISQIYDFDAQEAINRPAECDFSIVIPARNSAASLRYTLQTCLAINYDGDYEIVISDNSTNGNCEVYDLIQELNDSRIRYYKTPRDLHLPKSFEFAYLKARGEFIFAIGSDDGVLPWCLSVLTEVLHDYPDQQIVKWQRGFYAWPGFNGGQQNQFIIPGDYKKGQYEPHMVNTQDYIAQVLVNPSNMYALPMLYINSGFRRSYFKTLIEKTGRLWDGICQDIYMGVINSSINNKILELAYPLTIAGMTPASVGSQSNKAKKTMQAAREDLNMVNREANVGGFSKSRIENLMPELRSDISSLYNCLLRAVARGVLPDAYLTDLFDWKQMYLNCISMMNKADLFFDRNVHYMRYVATKHGKEFLRWFDESVYPVLMKPEIKNADAAEEEQIPVERIYKTGKQENGSIVYDASEYNVQNIYDAVKLFKRLSRL